MTVWHYVHFFETHLFLMTVSVSRHLLVVAATVRCCRWSCTSEHTDAEDNNQIDQYSHSKSVYQHKWYKYSLSFLALISTTETPPPPPHPPSVPLIKLIALQTLYKQHSYFLSVFFSPSSPSLLETPTQFNNQSVFFCILLFMRVGIEEKTTLQLLRTEPLGHSSCETLKLLMTFQVFYCKETS